MDGVSDVTPSGTRENRSQSRTDLVVESQVAYTCLRLTTGTICSCKRLPGDLDALTVYMQT